MSDKARLFSIVLSTVTALILLAVLSGCSMSRTTTTKNPDGSTTTVDEPASLLGPSDYSDGYAKAYTAHEQSKSAQATACKSDLPDNATPAEKAYAGAAQMLCVAMVGTQRFDLAKPTTGMDVLNNAVGQVPMVWALKSIKDVATAGIKNAGSSYGDNAQLTNSGNRTESTNNVAGSNNSGSATTSGTSEPTVVEVEPLIVPGMPAE